jgi:hypothetical protein
MENSDDPREEKGVATKGVEFVLTGDPARAKATVQQALETRKFKITWSDDWTGLAERGSKTANAFLGAAAQYFKVGVAVRSGHDGNAIVRLDRLSTGWMGGAIGASRTTKNMNTLRDELGATFQSAGVLVSANDVS